MKRREFIRRGALFVPVVAGFPNILRADRRRSVQEAVRRKNVGSSGDITTGQIIVSHFSESSGSTTADSSGNGHTGTLVAQAQFSAGPRGNELLLDGALDLVDYGDIDAIDGATACTIGMWVWPATTAFGVAIDKAAGGSESILSIEAGNLTPEFYVNNAGGASFGAISQSTYTHLACTIDGTRMKTYKNGVLAGDIAFTQAVPSTGNSLKVGGRSSTSPGYFNGNIDEFYLFSRALTATDIALLYAQ